MINIQEIINIAKQAGDIIMSYYNHEAIDVEYKKDSSPVTQADLASNELICESLSKLTPSIPLISEESEINSPISSSIFWSIDPLDATQSFIERNGEFTVNIALIKDNKPAIGVVYAPLSKRLYYVDNNKAYKQLDENDPIEIKTRPTPKDGIVVVTSCYYKNQKKLDLYLKDKKIDQTIPISSSIKICMIAEGLADLYPRFGRTMEWDTAAGHAILNAAGGSIKNLDGKELNYGHFEKGYYNPEFIAYSFSHP